MEKWTAVRKDDEYIYFEVERPGQPMKEERKFISALPLMFTLGGYIPQMGVVLSMAELPWSFDRNPDNFQIYVREKPRV